jgi:hypothetical protein
VRYWSCSEKVSATGLNRSLRIETVQREIPHRVELARLPCSQSLLTGDPQGDGGPNSMWHLRLFFQLYSLELKGKFFLEKR